MKYYTIKNGNKSGTSKKKIYWEVICREKGCNGYNKNYPEIVECKNKQDAIKKCKELEKNPDFEAVFIQARNDDEILDL